MNSDFSNVLPPRRFSAILTLAVLALIAWAAWQSIPSKQTFFSQAEFATNQKLATKAKFLSPPTAITGEYAISTEGVKLSTGGIIRYQFPKLTGFFRGVFQVIDKTEGEIQICAAQQGNTTVLLKRILTPAKQDFEQSEFTFIINLAAMPSETTELFLITSRGTINWREVGFINNGAFNDPESMPLNFLECEGYSAPTWDKKILLLQSPTRLDYRAPSGHHRLTFRCGINPSLFQKTNAETDGIGFKVELITATKTRELAYRLLQPFSRQSDRELQLVSVDWNLPEPGMIRLSATPGPASNIAWDWSVWQDFQLDPAGF